MNFELSVVRTFVFLNFRKIKCQTYFQMKNFVYGLSCEDVSINLLFLPCFEM